MKRKHNEGFTLLETLIAIVVLGVVVVPVCSSLVMSFRINAKAEQLMRDQLAVSSAVETLMAEGINTGGDSSNPVEWSVAQGSENRAIKTESFSGVTVIAVKNAEYYEVTFEAGEVLVETKIRALDSAAGEGGEP